MTPTDEFVGKELGLMSQHKRTGDLTAWLVFGGVLAVAAIIGACFVLFSQDRPVEAAAPTPSATAQVRDPNPAQPVTPEQKATTARQVIDDTGYLKRFTQQMPVIAKFHTPQDLAGDGLDICRRFQIKEGAIPMVLDFRGVDHPHPGDVTLENVVSAWLFATQEICPQHDELRREYTTEVLEDK